MRKYGLPYTGSKSAIADWVVENLPAGEMLIDIFAGGCAVTHAAMVSGKWNRILANDILGVPQVFMDAILGQYVGFNLVPDREQFHELKEVDQAIAILYSFGNDRTSYIWSEKLEPVKVAASRMLSAPSEHQRRMGYKTFIKELVRYIQQYGVDDVAPCGGGADY